MKKRILCVVLVLSLLVAMIPSVSASETEDLDLFSWLIRSEADATANSLIVKAIEYVSGKDLSSSIYKAYGYASDQVCPVSDDGLHEAIPSSISISYETLSGVVGSAYYTAQCKNCHKAFASDSSRLSSAYESYLSSLQYDGFGSDSSGVNFLVWTPTFEDLTSSNRSSFTTPILRYNSSYGFTFSNVSSNGSFTNRSATITTGSHSYLLHYSGFRPCAVSLTWSFVAPLSGSYRLLDSSFARGTGYVHSSSSSTVDYPLISFDLHYIPGSVSGDYISGSNISVFYSNTSSKSMPYFSQFLKDWLSLYGVSSSDPYFSFANDCLISFPSFRINNPIGGGTIDNSINIGTLDNSVVNLYDQTFVTPSGIVQPFDSFWFTANEYHVQYTDSDGISQDVQIDFNFDGISVTMPDGSTSKTDYTGPVLPPSVDGIETNTWLERIYNRLGDIFDKIGPGSGGGSDVDIDIDLPGSSDGSHSLWDILKDLLSPLTKLLSFLVGTVFDFLGEITDFFRALGSNDYFGIFDDSNFLQYEWSGDI